MTFVDLIGQIAGSLGDPLLWAVMTLVALRTPQRFIPPAAITAAFALEGVLWMIESGWLHEFRLDPWMLVGRMSAAWLAGSVVRFFIDRSRARTLQLQARISVS